MDSVDLPARRPLLNADDNVHIMAIPGNNFLASKRENLEITTPAVSEPQSSFACIYFFAGVLRKFDIRFWMEQLCTKHKFRLHMVEVDLLRPGSNNDLAIESTQTEWLDKLGNFNAVLVTPPCSSYSRATWANNRGPCPVRSALFPRGFPWLNSTNKARAELGNILCDFCWTVLERVHSIKTQCNISSFAEHPEDLGRVRHREPGAVPGSIWQSERFAELVKLGWWSGAYKQDVYGALTAKPTRSISDSWRFQNLAPMSVPTFDDQGFYKGPVLQSAGTAAHSLLRQPDETGPFRSAAAAAYPPLLCKRIAENLFNEFLWKALQISPSVGGIQKFGNEGCGAAVSFPPAPPLPATVQGCKGPLPFSLPEVDKLRLEQKLLDRKVLTAELLDPVAVVDRSCLSQAAVGPESTKVKLQTCKWLLEEGKDYKKAGFWGIGDPIHIQKSAGRFGRPMQDGGGLCCPGRWQINQRTFPGGGQYYTDSMDRWLDSLETKLGPTALQDVVYSLMAGKAERHPFENMLGDLKFEWANRLCDRGFTRPKASWSKGRTVDFGFIFMLAADLQDPDFSAMEEMCTGVRIGVGVDLPRTDTVWPPKGRWPLEEFDAEVATQLNDNYPSVALHREVLMAEIRDQIEKGWAIETTLGDASKTYGDISIASLSVIQESEDKYRTLFDGTNRVRINHRIKVLDGELCPSGLDVQAAISEDAMLVQPLLGLVIDVEKAHQQIPTDPRDWGHVGFSTDPMPQDPALKESWRVYLKTVGTYGIASASFHWARLGSLVQRLAFYICRLSYLFRYADDFLLLASNLQSGRFTRQVCRFMILLGVCDLPVKWGKCRGGFKAPYIGYLFDFEHLQGGLTERRCAWLVGWIRKVRADKIIVGRDLRSGIGRLSFSGVLWRWVLPFLGPFYAYIAVSDASAAWTLPPALLILLDWIADQVEANPFVTLRHLKPVGLGKYFKADARADGDTVVIGGYEAIPGLTLKQVRWFSFVLSPELTPWAYVKVNQAFRTVATLELFATLLCIMLFVERQPSSRTSTIFITGVTDNQGNQNLLFKGMTSKFPLYLVLLELAEQLKRKQVAIDLRWQPRETNVAADDLTNDRFEDFEVSLRLCPDLNSLEWILFPRLLKEAMELEQLIQERKRVLREDVTKNTWQPRSKKRKSVGMRISNPW